MHHGTSMLVFVPVIPGCTAQLTQPWHSSWFHACCVLQDLVLLPNATTGLNAVISSCKLQSGDTMYSLNIG
jgi:hypothetical protein